MATSSPCLYGTASGRAISSALSDTALSFQSGTLGAPWLISQGQGTGGGGLAAPSAAGKRRCAADDSAQASSAIERLATSLESFTSSVNRLADSIGRMETPNLRPRIAESDSAADKSKACVMADHLKFNEIGRAS